MNHRYDTSEQDLSSSSAANRGKLYLPPWRDCSTKFFAALRLQKISLTNKIPILPTILFSGMGIIILLSCSKDAHSWNRSVASPAPPPCDTCGGTNIATGKTVIVYPQGTDWVDRSDGRFECDLEHLLKNMVNPIDAYYINYLYVGSGRDARRLKNGVAINYDNGSLTWFGYKLNFQASNGQSPPESMALKLLMTHL